MAPRTHAAVTWLLNSGQPAIRLMTRRDILGEQADEDAGQVLAGAKVTALLCGQQPDGGFGVHPCRKWTGPHWRLVSLAELAIPPREPRAVAAAGHVLAWLASPGRRVPRIGGLARAHASIEGNALAACCRLGLAADPRVPSLAASLIAWQWPDGGRNCDPAATGREDVPAFVELESGGPPPGAFSRRAISGPLTPVKTGLSRSRTVRLSGQALWKPGRHRFPS